MGIFSFLFSDEDSDRVIPQPEFPPTKQDYDTARARIRRNVGRNDPQAEDETIFDLSIIQEWERLQKNTN